MASSTGFSAPLVRLRAWLDSQESLERHQGQPVNLTQEQRQAIVTLVATIPEPVVEGNYIGKLLEYAQNKRYALPELTVETIISSGSPRWRAQCACSWLPNQSFPQAGCGFENGDEPPTFAQKQTARQYAAKCALEYLQAQTGPDNSMNKGYTRKTPTATPGISPKRVVVLGSTAQAQCPSTTFETNQQDPNLTSTSQAVDDAMNVDTAGTLQPKSIEDEEDRHPLSEGDADEIIRRVETLAQVLGLGTPNYMLIADPNVPEFFSGQVKFSNPQVVLPRDAGIVQGVRGEKLTRGYLARHALAWMRHKMHLAQGGEE